MATQSFTSATSQWVLKTEKRKTAVTRQFTNNIIKRASRTAAGKTRGGTVKKGFIPRDLGTLAASVMSTLTGSTVLTGVGTSSYSLVVGGMKAGDVATFLWTAPYARRLHYEAGWMWVDDAMLAAPAIFAAVVADAKRRVK